MSIQEAVEMETVAHIDRLFSLAILGNFSSTGQSRVRRTALRVIGVVLSLITRVNVIVIFNLGTYSSWFATQTQTQTHSSASSMHPSRPAALVGEPPPNLLLTVLSYVVSALPDPAISLPAAVSLRNLCEANRKELAVHIGAFGELHAGLGNVPVSF